MRRAYIPKKRNTGNRQRKSVILLAAEGNNKTEKLYFSAFADEHYSIRFARGNDTDPMHLANSLLKEYKRLELDSELGDSAFCLVDGDLSLLQEKLISQAENKLSRIGGVMIVSNPCFEIWFLCHYTFSTKHYSSGQEVIETLKQYIPDYSKGKKNMYELLQEKTKIGIANAKRLEQYHIAAGNNIRQYDCQPRTDVYKVVEHIQINQE